MAREIVTDSVKEAYDWIMSWDSYDIEPKDITNCDIRMKNPPFHLDRDHWLGILQALKKLHYLCEQ